MIANPSEDLDSEPENLQILAFFFFPKMASNIKTNARDTQKMNLLEASLWRV